ncbi:MAG TPA: hypothetical protein VEJ63_17570 [Planctomycetota bacterium]|nr:hypothetical protein [Planctomycetota bacterium]
MVNARFGITAFAVIFITARMLPLAAAETIWIEGETAKTHTVTRHPWWYDKVKKDELSGGDYISHWNDKKEGEVLYEFEAPAQADYFFWVRANCTGTKLSYQLDGGEWKEIVTSANQNSINIAEDDKPDLRFVAWCKVGTVPLTKGAHKIAFRFFSDNNKHGSLDCFVFTTDTKYSPTGTLKPGETVPAAKAEEGRWPFTPTRDEFAADALLDLRVLNEKVAGESGFVKRSEDGNDLLLGNGKPARFWAINSAYHGPDPERHARFLAKRGINMVRLHSDITPPEGAGLMEINKKDRDYLWKCVAAYKKAGVYVTYSPYWAGPAKVNPKMGILDSGGNGNWGLLFFDKKLQEAYKSWLKQLFTEVNPHTGVALKDEPALGIIQIQNEDSLLFWTSQGIKGAARKELRRQFGEFLTKKYGSLDKASAAWAGAMVPADQDGADDFANGEAALYIIWELTQRRGGEGQAKRTSDQMEFFTQKMYDFNKMIGDYLKNELGCKQLVNAGNWRTADNVTMLDAERYSYGPNEVMGVNRYYGGAHEGQYNGWAIVNGDKFTDVSVLTQPRELPVTLKQVQGYPMIIPESSWVPPQGYQSEGPFTIAAYQALNGVDAYYWFATNEEDWRHPGSANGFLPSEGKWVCATPMLMGQWPAAAWMYRNGYIKQGEPVVVEERTLEDLWQRRMPIIAEDAGYDPNRDKDFLSKQSNIKDGVNPLAYLVGPVMVKYGGDPAKSKVADLAKFLDTNAKLVKSNTSELELDYGKGFCTLNAAKAQGVTGFLKRIGTFKLADVEIKSGNDYGSVLVVSLDGKDLKASNKVLVQVGTIARPTGWKTKATKVANTDGEEIVSYGRAPWQIVNGDVTVSFAGNSPLRTATVLDANMMKVKEIPFELNGDRKVLKFPADALYVVLQ